MGEGEGGGLGLGNHIAISMRGVINGHNIGSRTECP